MVQPVPGVEIVASRRSLDEFGPMAVSEDHQIEIRVRGEETCGQLAEPLRSTVALRGVSLTVPAFRAAHEADHACGPIGVNLSEQGARRPTPDHRFEGSVSPVPTPHSVSVRDIGLATTYLYAHGPVQELDTYFFGEKPPSPRVVIAAQQPDPHARIDEVGEHSQYREMPAQDHGLILEPEIEQVSVDQEVFRLIGNSGQELHEGGLVGRGSCPEVRIGNDDGGSFHGAKYRVALTNVKRSRPGPGGSTRARMT